MTDHFLPPLAQRFDPFSVFHKAQHYALCQTLARLASTDPHSPACVRYVLGQVYDMLRYSERLSRAIGFQSVTWIERHCPQAAARVALRHDEQLWSIGSLNDAYGAVVSMGAGMRGQALVSLQQGVRAYCVTALDAMAYTESEANPILWAAHDDRELAKLERAMLAEFDPIELKYALQWLIPAVHVGERARLFAILGEQDDGRLANSFVAMSKDLLCRADYDTLIEAIGRQPTGAVAGGLRQHAARARPVS